MWYSFQRETVHFEDNFVVRMANYVFFGGRGSWFTRRVTFFPKLFVCLYSYNKIRVLISALAMNTLEKKEEHIYEVIQQPRRDCLLSRDSYLCERLIVIFCGFSLFARGKA